MKATIRYGVKGTADQPELKQGAYLGVLADPNESRKKNWEGPKGAVVHAGYKSARTIERYDQLRGCLY